jgi:SAM-dependent methyltransferase
MFESVLASDVKPPEEEVAVCNNCGSQSYSVVFKAGEAQRRQIVKCDACGLMYSFPLNRPNTFRYDRDVPEEVSEAEIKRQMRQVNTKVADYSKLEPMLREMLGKPGKIIEVGCFSGALVNYFREKGWDASGIEPNGYAVAFARKKLGLEVRHGTLTTLDLPRDMADAIAMLHVIEHLDDPKRDVEAVRDLLRPGGVFVVETPSYDSLMYRMLGRRERSLACNGHIFFYTEKTLSDLLRQCGFSIVRVEKVGRTLSLERLFDNISYVLKNDKIRVNGAKALEKLSMSDATLRLNFRDMVRIYAKKAQAEA